MVRFMRLMMMAALLLVAALEGRGSFAGVGGYVPNCSKVTQTMTQLGESSAILGICGPGYLHVMKFDSSGVRQEKCLNVRDCGQYFNLCQEESNGVTIYKCFKPTVPTS